MTRRALVASVLGAGTVGLVATADTTRLDQFAPLSGNAWRAATREVDEEAPDPRDDATVRRDEWGIPQIEADDEQAAYFTVGYVQGIDRLFQLDLQRRQMRGQLSEVVGEATLESDRFHVSMDFVGAAEATWAALEGTEHAERVQAYVDGVNEAIEGNELPFEFRLLEYEPEPWTPVDTMLMQKQIAWTLTGNFDALRRERVDEALGPSAAEELFSRRIEHDAPILRPGGDLGDVGGATVDADASASGSPAGEPSGAPAIDRPSHLSNREATPTGADGGRGNSAPASDGGALLSWLSSFESPAGVGSNSWIVSGEHTDTGRPILANDPHLSLMTPPVWYEQHVQTPARNVRGVTFPGVPFVVIGRNHRGAWGFTNVGADVLDCYRYEVDEVGSRYRYRGGWREFETDEREIAVADADDETVTVRKTVHGPFLEREGEHVGVAWTGLTATRTSAAVDALGRSEGLEDALAAIEIFDEPTQNFVYADADGRTCYYATGKLPIRTGADGEAMPGDRVFDGSAGEGEWEGFTPYGESTWEGFVPFDEKPHAIDPAILATANQRVADDPDHYVGTAYAAPYRGGRIYDRLDDLTASGPTTLDDHAALQTDRVDPRAAQLVPALVDAVEREAGDFERLVDAAETLAAWTGEMTPDSAGALLFARWFEHFKRVICEPEFDEAGLDESYYPSDWAIATLPAESRFFADATRAETMVSALEATLNERADEGWDTYGDYNTTAPIEHPFGEQVPALNYDPRPIGGSRATINNYRVESAVGASTRLLAMPGGAARAILPGGNSGSPFGEHYDDQFQAWVDGEYRAMPLDIDGEDTTSEGDST